MLFLHNGIMKRHCYLCRLDDIVKTKDDSEYSRLSHYNKGLRLLTETLKSEKTQLKGRPYLYLLFSPIFYICYLNHSLAAWTPMSVDPKPSHG